METKYDIKKTSKNSLEDLLDIKKKNIKTEFWEETEKTIKINYFELNLIINEPYSELTRYMNIVFSKFNYSPIIEKLFSLKTKVSDKDIENLNHLWNYYFFEKHRVIRKTISDTFAQKIIYTFTQFINSYLIHIFSIPKISECLNTINKKSIFKIYDFNEEIKEEKNNEILLNIEKELQGNGCTFIFLKELRRLYDGLILASKCFKKTIMYFIWGIENLTENLFYRYVIENEVVSSLLYQIKLIFKLNLYNKDVLDLIDKFTIEMKNEIDQKEIEQKENNYNNKIDKIYNHPEFTERFPNFKKEYDEIDKYGLNKIPKKAEYIYKDIKDLEKDYKLNGDEIEYEEDEKIKEIKDIDELTKYIQGDEKKKKKKKKKKKENPINMLNKMNLNDKNFEDDQVSIVSHDTIFSNFKKEIRKDNIEEKDLNNL